MSMTQGAFDIDAMIAEVNPAPPRAPYTGRAPLRYTADYFTIDELAEALDEYRAAKPRWVGEDFIGYHHLWERGHSYGTQPRPGHAFEFIQSDLRCNCLLVPPYGYDTRYCFCVGDIVTQVICETCEWHAIGSESQTVAAMHDHAYPGWRDLPIVPMGLRAVGGQKPDKALAAWISENIPADWQRDGAPLITERSATATRCVAAYSPWGGFDISSTTLELERVA